MNWFGIWLVGVMVILLVLLKVCSNENFDKIDMFLGEELSWIELEWGEGWVELSFVVCGGRGSWLLLLIEFFYGWVELGEGFGCGGWIGWCGG